MTAICGNLVVNDRKLICLEFRNRNCDWKFNRQVTTILAIMMKYLNKGQKIIIKFIDDIVVGLVIVWLASTCK